MLSFLTLRTRSLKKKLILGGDILASIFKCALKLFTTTIISTEYAEQTATITVTYQTEIL